MNKKTLFVAALMVGVATFLGKAHAALNLSLDDCIRLALNENPTVKIDSMEIARVDYSKREAWGQLLPEVSFAGQYSRTLMKQTMYMDTGEGVAAIKMGRDNSYSASLSATIPVYVPQLWKSIKLSDIQILQSLETARASKLSLVNQVKNAYYALLLAEDSKNVLMANYETSKMNADIYAKKYELGVASEYDMLRANVAVTNLEPSIIDAENSINKIKLQLKLLMAMDAKVDFTPAESLDTFKATMYGRAMQRDTSLVNNTSVKQLDLQTDLLRQSLEVQKAAWLPTVAASANLAYSSMSNGNPLTNFQWNGSSSVGISVSLPLYQGGRRIYKQKQAEIAVREMKWQRENLTRSLNIQVQNELDNLTKSMKQVEANTRGVKQAEKAHDIMQESFKIGSGTFIQLRDTEDALMAARLSYYQSIYNYLVAESDLELVLGNAPIYKYTSK
ncbi:MAG: TolC family protein [Bacteroidales bacterium]|nr:TolC family protein [Bacteroidales bacterium]